MPYENDYNEKIANDIDAINNKFLLNEKMTIDPKSMVNSKGKLSGGFLGTLAGALLPLIISKLSGNGYSGAGYSGGGDEDDEESLYDEEVGTGYSGGSMYNNMRDKLEGRGKAYKAYKKQSEDKYACGMGMAGGSAFGIGVGNVRDTGEGVTDSKNLGMGMTGGVKKRGRKSKMGSGLAGGGVISDLGIPVISNIAGLFGLGSAGAGVAGGKKRGHKSKKMKGSGVISDLGIPIISNVAGLFGLGHSGGGVAGGARSDPFRPEKFYPKVLEQTAPSADKAVPPVGIVETSQNIGSSLSGFGKKGKGRSRGGVAGGMKRQTKKDKEDEKLGIEMKVKNKVGKKTNPWMELMSKVRKEHPHLKGVKAVIGYIKAHNLYKK